jgi:hypothetical protein
MYDFSSERVNATSVAIHLAESRAAKHWRTVWSHLTSHNAPWDHAGSVHHYKRDNCASVSFCPFRQKLNRHFDPHTQAAALRDAGRLGCLVAKPEVELHPLELQEDLEDQPRFKLTPCQVIKVTGVKSTTFGIHNDMMKIGNRIYGVNDVEYIFWRRAKFQLTGIEIFFKSGKSIWLDFLKIESRSMVNSICRRMTRKGAVLQRSPSHEFIQQLGICQSWANGKLSSFDYLMWLNVLGSRSFHDPSQYPIFPWVLSDYRSDHIDLRDPQVFRDLSKPLGAVGKARLDELVARLTNMQQYGYLPFLYSSYCSFPLAVFLYLVRMEPFTTLHIDLQGGRFDNARRVFQSIATCYGSVTSQMNDYRELIPEFFFDPEFLSNPNDFDLGVVDGKSISEVKLPPWARTPIEFIYLNRKALECEHVSQRLNHWIDLIFGYKQRGEECVLARNHYKDEIYDDVYVKESNHSERRRREIETLIEQVGQVPPQLFFAPHPTRELTTAKSVLEQQVIFDLPSQMCLFGSFSDVSHELVIFESVTDLLRYRILFSPALEVQFERIQSVAEVPSDLSSFVKVSGHQFAALCNQNLECVLFDLEKDCECRRITNVRRKITSIASCEELVSLSYTDGRIHGYSSRGLELFSIPTYRNSVLCSCMSRCFGVVVTGTDDRLLILASIHDGSTIRVIKLESVPVKVTVTPNWGFIVINAVDYVHGTPQYSLSVFNINGWLIRTVSFPYAVDKWAVWTSPTGFDFMLLSAHRGKLYAFEVFFLEVGSPVYRCCQELIALDYGVTSNIIIAVTGDGKVHMIPFLTRTIEKCV